jgi:CelD/BcsL family acetyltransferase involved in cellulose biosynthesis
VNTPLLTGPEKSRVEALLHDRGDISPPFSGDQWLLPWLDLYVRASDRSCVHWQPSGEGGVLFPLMIRTVNRRGFSLRELRFLGTGDADADEVATEYPDITCDGVADADAADMLAGYLQEGRGWDLFKAEAVLPDSVLARALALCGAYRMANGLRYCLAFTSDFEGWLSALGPSSRSKFRRTLRRVEEKGLSLRLDVPVAEGLEALSHLHRLRWQAKGLQGVFVSHQFGEFHRRMLAERRLGAHMAGLYQGEVPLAFWYGFDFCGVRYFYQGGFDPDAGDGFSPGEALHLLMIRDAISRRLRCYDFMKGREDSWKSRFGIQAEPIFDWVLPGKSVRGAMVRYGLHRSSRWQKAGETG